MGQKHTFRKGGIHPPENKLAASIVIEVLAVPPRVTIPLRLHIGAPAVALVAKGDAVKTGQLIASGNDFISANVHSSVTGVVESISPLPDISGIPTMMIVIKSEEDVWDTSVSNIETTPANFNAATLVEKIKQAGIVGLGGATFPSHVKLMVPRGKTVDTLIINGSECEPYLTSDHRLMLENPHEMLKGVVVMMRALGLEKAFVGIEKNKADAIDLLQNIIQQEKISIEIVPLKVKYPQGAEKMLIYAITGRKVPSLALPVETGCIVHNVGTALAVYDAVCKNKPLVERILTVTQKTGVQKNYRVRIGTPVSYVLEKAGIANDFKGKVIAGGPMMGKAIASLETPVTKGMSGLLVLDEKDAFRPAVENCIRCARCVSACPMGLEPYILQQMVFAERYEETKSKFILDCMECGSCQYICPSARPLLDYIRKGKVKLNELLRKKS
ncbi:MAG: electron transport complex subunit RsxC [Bacteroidota bacterium]